MTERNKTTEVPFKIRKHSAATCYITAVILYRRRSFPPCVYCLSESVRHVEVGADVFEDLPRFSLRAGIRMRSSSEFGKGVKIPVHDS